jgi:NTP pyrophosphatase (non-canonical NTP hydrolase)
MAEYTREELIRIKEERNISQLQINNLQRLVKEYAGKVTKEEILDTYRRLGYIATLLEEDLKTKYGEKVEKSVRISYDLLPSGKVENFTVEEVD